MKQSALRSLWDASPGDTSQPPVPDRSLGRRPSVTLFQRGTASDNTLKWTFFIQHLSHDQWRAEHTVERSSETCCRLPCCGRQLSQPSVLPTIALYFS